MQFYIKDGSQEKGPLTISELKRLKISKSTMVRFENAQNWNRAGDVQELKILFKRRFRLLKVLVALLVVAYGIQIFLNESQLKSSRVNPFTEVEEEILPPPPSIDYNISQHDKKFFRELFKDCNLSGKKDELVESCNYSNYILRNKAVSIAGKDEGTYNLGQICNIFDYCYNNWKYVNDPRSSEIVEYASNTISNGLNGDCDDFAVLVCSMILSIGGEARINYAYDSDSGHAFTEVNIGKTKVNDYISKRYKDVYDDSGIWTRTDPEGNNWLNLDWFANHPGGKYFNYTHGTTFYILQDYCNDF